MNVGRRCAIVTGAGRGIGAAIAKALADREARVVLADLDPDAADGVAAAIRDRGGVALSVGVDVRDEESLRSLVRRAESAFGPVDIFCSNAGVMTQGGAEATDDVWNLSWEVNVMAHVYAARAVLPGMRERGSGHLVSVASAAGLLTTLGGAPYAVSKHAAVALAEWLSISHYDEGIRVSCVCPELVDTQMLTTAEDPLVEEAIRRSEPITPERVAHAVVDAIESETFFVFPHPEVAEYYRRRAHDPERWQRGMVRLQAMLRQSPAEDSP